MKQAQVAQDSKADHEHDSKVGGKYGDTARIPSESSSLHNRWHGPGAGLSRAVLCTTSVSRALRGNKTVHTAILLNKISNNTQYAHLVHRESTRCVSFWFVVLQGSDAGMALIRAAGVVPESCLNGTLPELNEGLDKIALSAPTTVLPVSFILWHEERAELEEGHSACSKCSKRNWWRLDAENRVK